MIYDKNEKQRVDKGSDELVKLLLYLLLEVVLTIIAFVIVYQWI